MPVPIPPKTIPNLTGAVGDLIRAAYSAGAADERKEDVDAHIGMLAQFTGQLLALVLQREPTSEEMAACVGV